MSSTIVDSLFEDFQSLSKYLDDGKEFSLKIIADENFSKSILLCSASYFESFICNLMMSYINSNTNDNALINSFVKNKAVSRQYHTYFNWEEANANSFFGLFGEDFKKFMQNEVKQNDRLDKSIKAFLEIGGNRNRLIHQNYGAYFMEKTPVEIYELYKTSLYFLEIFESELFGFIQKNPQ